MEGCRITAPLHLISALGERADGDLVQELGLMKEAEQPQHE
jgi:hypothetical protein